MGEKLFEIQEEVGDDGKEIQWSVDKSTLPT
jgi:hypothetical protein